MLWFAYWHIRLLRPLKALAFYSRKIISSLGPLVATYFSLCLGRKHASIHPLATMSPVSLIKCGMLLSMNFVHISLCDHSLKSALGGAGGRFFGAEICEGNGRFFFDFFFSRFWRGADWSSSFVLASSQFLTQSPASSYVYNIPHIQAIELES